MAQGDLKIDSTVHERHGLYSSSNGQTEKPEKILVYLGPSLSLVKARAILPGAIYKGPCKQGDIVSDVVTLQPNRILLIDGAFRDNLSPWHKEIVYALQFPSVKGIYGASSMGALRAAELDWLGMIGVGRIYEWYRDQITEDDSEVAVSYAELHADEWRPLTVPLVDIRAGVEQYKAQFAGTETADLAQTFLEEMRKVYYAERTVQVCEQAWRDDSVPFPLVHQKMLDAAELLANFRTYKCAGTHVPTPDHLSPFFQALYERDRRIRINGQEVRQQHIDAHVMLYNPEYERICWDASNQELALLLCDCLCVLADINDVTREGGRFQQRAGIETGANLDAFLENNGWTRGEFDRLMIQNARIRKLQHALTVTKTYRRNTQGVLDYLRTHQAFDYWASQVAQAEERLSMIGADDWLGVDLDTPVWTKLQRHYDEEGLECKATPEDYLLETGFSNAVELGIALARIQAGKEQD